MSDGTAKQNAVNVEARHTAAPWRYDPAHDHGLPTGQRLKSWQRESGLVETAARQIWWRGMRLYLRAWHRLEIVGRERLTIDPPFILVANHASHLDAIILTSALPAKMWDFAFPIAAADTFFSHWTTTMFSAGVLNALPMWRRSGGVHAVEELRSRITTDRCAFVIFPEGTRSRDGRIGPFKPGIGRMVAGTSVPVIPCRLAGAFESWPPTRRTPRRRPVRLNVGEPLTFANVPNTRAGWESVASTLELAVRALH